MVIASEGPQAQAKQSLYVSSHAADEIASVARVCDSLLPRNDRVGKITTKFKRLNVSATADIRNRDNYFAGKGHEFHGSVFPCAIS